MAEQTVTTSPGAWKLNSRDFIRGLLMAVIGAVISIAYDSINAGNFDFNWSALGKGALVAGLSYLLKNLGTPSEIVIVNPPAQQLEDVKNGDKKPVVR